MLTVGTRTGSLAAIDNVIVSPAFARVVSAALSDTMLTDVRVGGVRSMVTTLESVTADTVEPPLLARSLNAIERDALPSVT
jgi:hypothetical protein